MNLFGSLEPGELRSLLRRLSVTAGAAGAAGIVVALLLGSPWGAIGVAAGVGLAFLNVRAVDRQVARTHVGTDTSSKAVRRAVGSRSVLRLGAITAVAVALLLIEAPLGIGIVVGLVIFQLCFVGNVIGAVLARGGVG